VERCRTGSHNQGIVDKNARTLSAFPENLSPYAERTLQRLGVGVQTGRPIQDITESGVTAGGALIPTATMVWGAGVAASLVVW
jgi:NADH dehydrogenase